MKLVEAMARAILDAHDWSRNDKEDDEPSGWDTLTEDWKTVFRTMALHALKAIREPTYAMAEAGANESGEYGFGPHSATEVFTAMIDHAIKESEQQ